MNNPYHWSKVNLKILYGRDSLTNELVNKLPAPQPISFALTGGRRMGKTSVLRYVEHDFLNTSNQWRDQGVLVIVIYVDGLALMRPITPELIWTFIFNQIWKSTNLSSGLPPPITSFADFVSRVNFEIEQCSDAVRIVVLFDEIEPILAETWADAYFANWRALLSNIAPVSHCMAAVFSGARELVRLRDDIGSPLMDILEFRSLKNLTFSEMRALASEPINTDLGDDFYDCLYELAGGHPMLTQYIMQFVFDHINKSGVSAEDLAHTAADQFVAGRSWQFSDWWYKYCTHGAQKIYVRLPETFEFYPLRELVNEFGLRQANDALAILLHVGIVVSNEDEPEFKRAGTMFSKWQMVHGALTPSTGHDIKIYQMLQNIEPSFADKYRSAWSILATDHANYSGAVSEMRDTITAVLHKLAPDTDVVSSSGFCFEKGQTKPTRRQRTKFIVKSKPSLDDTGKSLSSDMDLLETQSDQLAKVVGTAYGTASGLTHTTSTHDMAYQALKQGDSILAQLLG